MIPITYSDDISVGSEDAAVDLRAAAGELSRAMERGERSLVVARLAYELLEVLRIYEYVPVSSVTAAMVGETLEAFHDGRFLKTLRGVRCGDTDPKELVNMLNTSQRCRG